MRKFYVVLLLVLTAALLMGCGDESGDISAEVIATPEVTAAPEQATEDLETVVAEDIPFIDQEGYIPENDYGNSLPGIDMTPWVGQVITVKTDGEETGSDFFVISVDEKYPSKAFCLYLYPHDGETVLPDINRSSIEIQHGDKIQYAHTSFNNPSCDPKDGYNVKYENSYVDEICTLWAESSPLYDYMLDTNIGIGDTIEFSEDETIRPTYHQAYTSSINRRAYAPSVKELLDVDMLNFEYYENNDAFWLRTISAPVSWWERIGASSTYEFAAIFRPYGESTLDSGLPRPGRMRYRSYFNCWLFEGECRPAIACNLYNLTSDMVSRSVYDKTVLRAEVNFDFVDAEGNSFNPEGETLISRGPLILFQYMDELEPEWIYNPYSPINSISYSDEENTVDFSTDPLHPKFLGYAILKMSLPDGYVSRAGETIIFHEPGYYQIVIEKVSDIEAGKMVDEDKLVIKDNNLWQFIKMG